MTLSSESSPALTTKEETPGSWQTHMRLRRAQDRAWGGGGRYASPPWLGHLGAGALTAPGQKEVLPSGPDQPCNSSLHSEGSTEGKGQTRGQRVSPGPRCNSYQGLMGGMVHSCHRIIHGWFQVVKCQLNVLLGGKGERK